MTKAKLNLLFYFVDHLMMRPEGKELLKKDIISASPKKQDEIFGMLFKHALERDKMQLDHQAEFLESEIEIMKKNEN